MQAADVIIVGGGPAGSTCASQLRQGGVDVLVLDSVRFPRLKLCAGWVTPDALGELALEPGEYPHGILTFDELRLHWRGISLSHRCTQHSIRRVEFDEFLLRRSGAPVVQHRAQHIRRDGPDYVIDKLYRCRYLVGAAGTRCPVYRELFHANAPRDPGLQTATYEQEFAYPWTDSRCHLWFFADGLPGYAWYVPKANGYVNVGLGGMAEAIRRRDERLQDYWHAFTRRLHRLGLVQNYDYRPRGYSYYLRGAVEQVRNDNAFLVGDAAGLATRDLCEGIGPAICSGKAAARAILDGEEYLLDKIPRRSANGLFAGFLEGRFAADEQKHEQTLPATSRKST